MELKTIYGSVYGHNLTDFNTLTKYYVLENYPYIRGYFTIHKIQEDLYAVTRVLDMNSENVNK